MANSTIDKLYETEHETKEVDVVYSTTDYSQFNFIGGNRKVNLNKPKTKKLRKQMEELGWLSSKPMTVYIDKNGVMYIVDGQHRFILAQILGIPVKYMITKVKIDIAKQNDTQSSWTLRDYLESWKYTDKQAYFEVSDFTKQFPNISLTMAIHLLGGSSAGNESLRTRFIDGVFTISNKSKRNAYKVGNLYESLIKLNKNAKHTNLLKALYKCSLVESFNAEELLDKCEKKPSMILPLSKTTDWLDMLQDAYNYCRRDRIPLRFQAEEAIKNR